MIRDMTETITMILMFVAAGASVLNLFLALSITRRSKTNPPDREDDSLEPYVSWALSEDSTRRDIGLIKLDDIAATTSDPKRAATVRSILEVMAASKRPR